MGKLNCRIKVEGAFVCDDFFPTRYGQRGRELRDIGDVRTFATVPK